jgi:hypothetical protein
MYRELERSTGVASNHKVRNGDFCWLPKKAVFQLSLHSQATEKKANPGTTSAASRPPLSTFLNFSTGQRSWLARERCHGVTRIALKPLMGVVRGNIVDDLILLITGPCVHVHESVRTELPLIVVLTASA